jgi:hypothetical protein
LNKKRPSIKKIYNQRRHFELVEERQEGLKKGGESALVLKKKRNCKLEEERQEGPRENEREGEDTHTHTLTNVLGVHGTTPQPHYTVLLMCC